MKDFIHVLVAGVIGALGNSVTVHYNAKFNAVTQLIMAIHAGVS